MTDAPIAFSPPDIHEDDIAAVVDVLRSGWITTGPVGRAFEQRLTEYTGSAGTVTLNSATAGLELALRVAGIGPGDEVIVPAYTYTASASVIDHVGATIRMVDTREDVPVPAVDAILAAVNERTAAIITVDLAGIPFDVPGLIRGLAGSAHADNALANALGRPIVVSDSAHSLGARLPAGATGSLADFTAFSFHAVKNLTTAEGGSLGWNGDIAGVLPDVEQTIRTLSLHGQTKDARAKMQAGAWEYDIIAPAYKMNMPDVLAALGLSQMDRYEDAIARRAEILAAYTEGLSGLGVTVMDHAVEGGRSSGHLAIAFLSDEHAPHRDAVITAMAQKGVAANVHYKPLPLLTAYRDLGFSAEEYPHAMGHFTREITLPLHTLLTDADVDRVIRTLRAALAESEA